MKVAVVGIGGWGKNHLRVVAQLRGEGLVDTIYAVDIDESRLRWAEKVYGAMAVRGVDAAANIDVDAAIVATPTTLHAAHASVFLSRGIPTLVEKPFAASLQEAYQLIDIAGKTLVSTGYLLRFHQGVRYVKNNLDKLGRFLTAYGKRTSRWPLRPGDVGVVKDLAIHDIDLVTYITGLRATSVYASGGSTRGMYEDHVQIFSHYDGASAIYEANWLTPYKFRKLELTGEQGIFIVDFATDEIYFYGEEGVYRPRLEIAEPLLIQDREFLKAASGRGGEVVNREDIIYTMKFCEAAILSIKTGRAVSLGDL
ncbi:Gfo/Idh/MocA family protein [Pyrobaculum aerophilum]|uniref:Oxidoreductase n=1 Tax=Pyrobaculum aerophilum TaxID=13773 RepID=A0A371R164_9CREN|nr:Gfo/Idh/MocA family oxidoreductase [Pyrobaculum aerophilum]RFA95997.1 oxidoreductase [Pyrobaculum aerophilum]RFA97178.1 oxidoreductase [Pyrobaculum aerophilum]